MAETIVMRVKRIVSASVEDMVDRMERAGGTAVMREAIREVERAVDGAPAEHGSVVARRLQAERQQRMASERIQTLGERAGFALDEGREDLAEAAVARQVDMENQIARLCRVVAEAREEAATLERAIAALEERRATMAAELEGFEAARREAERTVAPPRVDGRRRTVERAEQAFERAMSGAGGAAGMARADAATAAGMAELDTMQRGKAVRDRLAALKADRAA